MNEELSRRWAATVQTALNWREGEALEPLLEALAGASALEVLGQLEIASANDRDGLRRVGQRALLHVGAERARLEDDDDAVEALELAVDLARDGLRALSPRLGNGHDRGTAGATAGASTRPRVSDRDLARLRGGHLDLLEAAQIARAVRRCPASQRALDWSGELSSLANQAPRVASRTSPGASSERTSTRPERVVRLAAAEAVAMRDPQLGRCVSRFSQGADMLAEMYIFEDGLIAIYTQASDVVRVEATGLRTESMQPGYWSGFSETPTIRGRLYIGELSLEMVVSTT